MTIVTATRLEERAARREIAEARIVRTGVGRGATFDDAVISCGLAGGLRDDLAAGSVVIPDRVVRADGAFIDCDAELAGMLRAASRRLGREPVNAALLTSPTLVRGSARSAWAQQCAAADMETGLLRAPRLAAVRVVLDTPQRELSEAWLSPLGILFTPSAWRELPWLAREAPRYARLAARVVAIALRTR